MWQGLQSENATWRKSPHLAKDSLWVKFPSVLLPARSFILISFSVSPLPHFLWPFGSFSSLSQFNWESLQQKVTGGWKREEAGSYYRSDLPICGNLCRTNTWPCSKHTTIRAQWYYLTMLALYSNSWDVVRSVHVIIATSLIQPLHSGPVRVLLPKDYVLLWWEAHLVFLRSELLQTHPLSCFFGCRVDYHKNIWLRDGVKLLREWERLKGTAEDRTGWSGHVAVPLQF